MRTSKINWIYFQVQWLTKITFKAKQTGSTRFLSKSRIFWFSEFLMGWHLHWAWNCNSGCSPGETVFGLVLENFEFATELTSPWFSQNIVFLCFLAKNFSTYCDCEENGMNRYVDDKRFFITHLTKDDIPF